jgi:hypothetical protein
MVIMVIMWCVIKKVVKKEEVSVFIKKYGLLEMKHRY